MNKSRSIAIRIFAVVALIAILALPCFAEELVGVVFSGAFRGNIATMSRGSAFVAAEQLAASLGLQTKSSENHLIVTYGNSRADFYTGTSKVRVNNKIVEMSEEPTHENGHWWMESKSVRSVLNKMYAEGGLSNTIYFVEPRDANAPVPPNLSPAYSEKPQGEEKKPAPQEASPEPKNETVNEAPREVPNPAENSAEPEKVPDPLPEEKSVEQKTEPTPKTTPPIQPLRELKTEQPKQAEPYDISKIPGYENRGTTQETQPVEQKPIQQLKTQPEPERVPLQQLKTQPAEQNQPEPPKESKATKETVSEEYKSRAADIKPIKGVSRVFAKKRPIVVLDAGHGDHDSGAVGNGAVEKKINLAAVLQLGKILEQYGCDVRYSRKTDKFLKLGERTEFANNSKADVFISLHCNSLPRKVDYKVKGVELYIMASPRDKDSLNLAITENKEVSGGVSSTEALKNADKRTRTLLLILGDMQQNNKINESTEMCEMLSKSIKSEGLTLRKVSQAPFFVLRGAAMPAVLVEMGYLTHPNEAANLNSAAYRDRICKGLAQGIVNYIRSLKTF